MEIVAPLTITGDQEMAGDNEMAGRHVGSSNPLRRSLRRLLASTAMGLALAMVPIKAEIGEE